MAGKGGGAWKVAYADFVTAMMAFFLVMWIVAQNKPAVKEAVAGYFNDPYGTSTKPGKSSTNIPGKDGAPPPTPKTPGKGKPQRGADAAIKVNEDGEEGGNAKRPSLLVLHDGKHNDVGALVPFADDTAELDEAGRRKLDELLPELLGKPFKIEIRGHTAGRILPKESVFQDAWELAYARSLSAMRYLESKGVEAKRFRLSASGAYEPKSLGQNSGLRTQNSRVEVYVLNEIVDDLMGNKKERDERTKAPSAKKATKSKPHKPA